MRRSVSFTRVCCFREFDDAPAWRGRGMHVLTDEMRRQVSADGVHFEQSTCYHRYTIEIYQHFTLLAARSNLRVPAEIESALEHMVDFLLAVRWPNGSVPAIGDADGGWLMPLARRLPGDGRGLFADRRGDVRSRRFRMGRGRPGPGAAVAARDRRVGDVRRTGAAAANAERFENIRDRRLRRDARRLERPGESDDRRRRSAWVFRRAAATGTPICSAFSSPPSVSRASSTPAITATPLKREWRDFFRSTGAHNTVMIDGRSQCEPAGPFRWRRRPHVLLREWRSNPELDFLDAEHDAFCNLSDPVVHRRRVLFIKPSYWIVIDDLVGASRHRIDLMFQFAPMRVTLGPRGWTRARAHIRRRAVDGIVRFDQSGAGLAVR